MNNYYTTNLGYHFKNSFVDLLKKYMINLLKVFAGYLQTVPFPQYPVLASSAWSLPKLTNMAASW